MIEALCPQITSEASQRAAAALDLQDKPVILSVLFGISSMTVVPPIELPVGRILLSADQVICGIEAKRSRQPHRDVWAKIRLNDAELASY